jgi:uncharacterized membrane protein YbaN (DUF454 family)
MRLFLLGVGWGLLIIGVIGGLLPFLQGWPFGVAGAAILYIESRSVQRTVRRWRQKNPKLEKAWLKLRLWLRARRKAKAAKRAAAAAP